jgi:uncharacterized protein (UPF0332 family)
MEVNALLAKAEQFIRSAVLLAENDDLDSAASRLYYAMFFTAEALLSKLGLTYSSHHAIIAAYGQHFAKTERIDPRFHRAMISAFDIRQRGDYAADSGLVQEDIDSLMLDATSFLAAAQQWLSNAPKSVEE